MKDSLLFFRNRIGSLRFIRSLYNCKRTLAIKKKIVWKNMYLIILKESFSQLTEKSIMVVWQIDYTEF